MVVTIFTEKKFWDNSLDELEIYRRKKILIVMERAQ
jgi:hypothetical protein